MQWQELEDQRQAMLQPEAQRWLAAWREPPGLDQWRMTEQDLYTGTPREGWVRRMATRVPFYLIDSVNDPTAPMVDVGCGRNWFRGFYPNIVGVDPAEGHGDHTLRPEWWSRNQGRWRTVISINSLHFQGVQGLAEALTGVTHLLAHGGRAMVSVNRARLRDTTQGYSDDDVRRLLRQQPRVTGVTWLARPVDAALDGNLWIWMA